jgi:hypothetical protein
MYLGRLFTIVLITISAILIVLLMMYANTATVNAQNTSLESAVSQGGMEEKIIKEDSSNIFIISTPNAEGSNSKENDDECKDDTDKDDTDKDDTDKDDTDKDDTDKDDTGCSNRNLDENKEKKEMQSASDILLPFP